jgi:micrococcal nuclease
MGNLIRFPRRQRLPASWQPYVRRRRRATAEFRMMVWLGLILGLLVFQALRWTPQIAAGKPPAILPLAAMPPVSAPVDPWPESTRSRDILASQEGAPAMNAEPQPARTASFGSVRVIDGDTFDHDGVRIRIANIDTPETHPSRCAYEAELGGRATRRLEVLLAAGPFELVPIGHDMDRYGRKLRRVVRGGSDIGAMLVAEGLARPYEGGPRAGWCG